MVRNNSILIRSFFKNNLWNLTGIFVFVLIVSSVSSALITIWNSTKRYEKEALAQTDYKDVSFWISNLNFAEPLVTQLENLERADEVSFEKIIFADYEMNQKESDSEVQLIAYENNGQFKFFKAVSQKGGIKIAGFDTVPTNIKNGEIYLPVSFCSSFNAKSGDVIQIITARNGIRTAFTVAGFFEDAVAGSTLIGMKRFLINIYDYEKLCSISQSHGIDSLARKGFLIHVAQKTISDKRLSDSDFIKYLNENSSLPRFTEQVHSASVIFGFMMLLQNIFSAIFAVFVFVLFIVTVCVLIHTIKNDIKSERKNCGILKELGFTSKDISLIFEFVFSIPIILGLGTGFALSFLISNFLVRMLIFSSGLLVNVKMPYYFCIPLLIFIFLILFLSIIYASLELKNISPLEAVHNLQKSKMKLHKNPLHQKAFQFHLALRQLLSRKSSYIGVLLVSLLLVFFASIAGRLDSWLGKNGEGLMEAFNPADHHLGVQSFGSATREDFEKVIENESEISGYYMLAMPMLRLNGTEHKANVISTPEEYHIIHGKTCLNKNEIVITEFLLKDLGLKIGDSVQVASRTGSEFFTISGTYQCANDMGENFGMNREGFLSISEDNPALWCHHYFLRNPEKRIAVMQELEKIYGTEIHVHENAWPGLYSILSAMKKLITCMYILSAVFVVTAVLLSSKKLLKEEAYDIKRYNLLGYTPHSLSISFTLRFLIVCLIGSSFSLFLSSIITDPLANCLVRIAGISGFVSNPSVQQIITPVLILTMSAVFVAFGAAEVCMLKRHN